MKNNTCLLVKTKDKRKFLTHKKNLSMLEEFASTFNVEVSLVRIFKENTEVLGLEHLAPALCDSNYDTQPDYELISRLFPKRSRSSILKNADTIKSHIRQQFQKGKNVSLKELKKRFKENYAVTDACLCNHLSMVRKEFEDGGYLVKKTGAGVYCLDGETSSDG